MDTGVEESVGNGSTQENQTTRNMKDTGATFFQRKELRYQKKTTRADTMKLDVQANKKSWFSFCSVKGLEEPCHSKNEHALHMQCGC